MYTSCDSITSVYEQGIQFPLTGYEIRHNRCYTGARQTIEWNFGGIINMFVIIKY